MKGKQRIVPCSYFGIVLLLSSCVELTEAIILSRCYLYEMRRRTDPMTVELNAEEEICLL